MLNEETFDDPKDFEIAKLKIQLEKALNKIDEFKAYDEKRKNYIDNLLHQIKNLKEQIQELLNSATLLIVSGHCGQNRPECDFSCSNWLFAIS